MLTKNNVLAHTLLGGILLFQACAPTLPNLKKPNITLPREFPKLSDKDGKASASSTADIKWNDFFTDEKLKYLIETSLSSNQELAILEQEINISNNEIMSRQGEYLPKFQALAASGLEKVERFSTESANKPTRFGRIGIATTWELDIWKKLRNAAKSAYFSYLSSIEGRRYVVTNLIAEISNTYFELMALDNELQIVDSYVDVLSQIKKMVTLQLAAGKVTSLAVKRFEAELYKNQSRRFMIQQEVIITQNKLNLLLGRFPQNINRNSKEFLDYKSNRLEYAVPTKLLDNRPDVKKAGYNLEASKLNVEVAKARFYPSLSIDGEAGYEAFNSKHFDGTPTSAFYGIVGGLTAPILNRKAIKADYFSANNKQIQALYNYEFTLIQAYTEVANQMTMIRNLDMIYSLKEKQVKALTESIEVSNILFKAARINYIESLFTQRDALDAQLELIEIKKQQLTASVNLYKALGGGWRGINDKVESNY